MPVLPLARSTSSGSMPRAGCISAMTSSGRAMGRSILLSTGTMVRSLSMARIGVGDGLGLHALEGVDQQDDALAGGQAARHLVVEIDVAGRVDQVQLVVLALVVVVDGDGVHLDGDAAFAFEVHVVEDLVAEVALR